MQLAEWGRRQHRQVTAAQLRAIGWDGSLVNKRRRQGRLHPVFAEVYSLGGPPQTDQELWMASVLTYGRGTALGATAAAELYELLRYPLKELHVVTLRPRRARDGIVTHCRSGGYAWRFSDGIPVTGPEQTILDCATTVRNDRAYRRIVRKAQADGLTTHTKLLVFAARCQGQRGVTRLKKELAAGPSPTRSALEDDVLEIFRTGGEPIPNHVIEGDEIDLFFPALQIGIEVDGPSHDNPTAQADDTAKTERLRARGVRLLRVS